MNDVSDLKEDFAELSDVLPQLPDEVNGARQSAQHLADAAATLLNEVDAARQDVAMLLTHVRNTLPGFTLQVETLEKRLEASLGAAEKGWTEGGSQLADGEEALQTAAEQVDADRKELMQALFEAGTRVDQASAEGAAAIDRIETVAGEGAGRIKAAAAAVTEEVGTLRALLERTKASLNESREVFLEQMTQFVGSVHFDTGILLERMMTREGQYTGHLTEVAHEVESASEATILLLGKRIEAMTGPLGLAAENCRIQVERLAAAATAQQESLVKALDDHSEALDDLKQAKAPLPEGIKQIHEAVVRMRQQ